MAILIYGLGVNAAGEFKHTMHNSENVHKEEMSHFDYLI